jgi:hypothetical protein
VFLLGVALVACGKDPPAKENAPPITALPSAAATAKPAAPDAHASSAAPAAPSTTSAASSAPAANIVRSSRPTPLEWCKGDTGGIITTEPNTHRVVNVCRVTAVREWLLVVCPKDAGDDEGNSLGTYDRAVPGGGSMATADEIAAGPIPDAKDGVVISLRPGTKAKPTFFYRPSGHPEWTRDLTFSFELPEDARSLDDRRFGDTRERLPLLRPENLKRCESLEADLAAAKKREADEKAAKSAADDAKGQPDVEGMAPIPSDEAWAAEKDIVVTGSSALGCKTRLKDRWFWLRCEGKVVFSAVEVERGKRATQTKATVEKGTVTLVTPYVEETDLRAKLTFEGGEKFLHLRWPKGKQPFQVATVDGTR